MKLNKRIVFLLLVLLVGIFFLFFYESCTPKKQEKEFLTETGRVFGTFYKITYESPDGKSLKPELEAIFRSFELSLSVYNDSSVISRINRNDPSVVVDEYFRTVFETGQRVSEITDGAFDMTVAPLVNAWGFGFTGKDSITPKLIHSLLKITGYEKVRLEGDRIVKDNPAVMLDASAIAKGYACDVVAGFLTSQGIENYMVEIGGEVVVKGMNERNAPWTIGITKPVDDSTMMITELHRVIRLENGAVATSGNYRQYYHKDGKKYAHAIDPHTGYPVDHNLLSVTVIAPNGILADAYATAFLVMGVEQSILVANFMPDIEAYFIYSNYTNTLSESYTEGFKKYFVETN
jgi:thiamine biosynthesis lipoprotein